MGETSFLCDEPIHVAELVKRVMRPSDGACVTFEGVVRNHHLGKNVESILYEAYRPMAEKEFARIVRAVSEQYPAVNIAIRHRLGQLGVGETSIVIVACSPHRAESYDASRMLIDQIKQSVPIWKKERSADGEEWVGWQWK